MTLVPIKVLQDELGVSKPGFKPAPVAPPLGGEPTTEDMLRSTIDREAVGGILNSVVGQEMLKNGQDPEIAVKLDLLPVAPDDPPDVEEMDLLNPESEFGQTWLSAAKAVASHFINKSPPKSPGWLGQHENPVERARREEYGGPLVQLGLMDK